MRAYAELTEEWCEQAGLSKMTWNGTIPEYWVSLRSDEELKKVKKNERDYRAFEYRIGVRFNEYPGVARKVYLLTNHYQIELKGVDQPFQLRNASE